MPTAPADSEYGTSLVPTVTPFANGSVDADAVADLSEFVLENGADGLVPCGTTGEFASLTLEEYETVVSTSVDAADGAPVLPGAASTSVAGTLERIDVAADAGADAVLIVLPYFHGANDPAGNERFLRAVLDDTSLPIVLYNIPSCVGQSIDADLIEAVADHPDLAGMKDTSGDLTHLIDVIRRTGDDFHLFQGWDSQLVPAVSLGATGGINAVSNYLPGLMAEAIDAAAENDVSRGRDLQLNHIAPLFDTSLEFGFAPTTKAALIERGVIDDDGVRPPLVELDDDQVATVRDVLEETLAVAE
ncbi:dihydrodipicolinate synthase family protein [Haloplanus rubicundus]|uniref:Dihydrodipicolinate synthase family protein n=1 Tax=Haloplanus rubicundus TaxID=1547898 RepID=A0A345EGR9_9EURY|nr:dihydrodipicolinate synthase family protein [Haloplanus rubicundus]AXG11391.1 dihydrodipicolinate synthase family protein [Haloplanus rubicundus]